MLSTCLDPEFSKYVSTTERAISEIISLQSSVFGESLICHSKTILDIWKLGGDTS